MFEALQCYNEIEVKLNKLHNDIVVTREENEFNEIILEQLRLKLTKLIEELAKAPSVSLQQDSSPFIQRVFIVSSSTGKSYISRRILIYFFFEKERKLFVKVKTNFRTRLPPKKENPSRRNISPAESQSPVEMAKEHEPIN